MNIKEYISSGIIESYVLGMLNEQERLEFEKACNEYPEIKSARDAFEIQVEKQAMENAMHAPQHLKQRIADELFSGKQNTPVIPITEAPVRKISSNANGWLRFAAAASFILLAGSLWWNMILKNENRNIKANLTEFNNRLAQIEQDSKILKGSNKIALLAGTQYSPQSSAIVYWDTTSHDVYLLINNLPVPASDEQYQLWALLDGKPIDMGVFEITQKPLQLYRMKNAQAAQAFAITIERKGGSPTPTLEKMVVLGNL